LRTQYTVKAVLEKLNKKIKELDLIQVCEELLIKELFIRQYKLCLIYENYFYLINVKD